MRHPALLFSTNHPKVDEILQGITGLFEVVFPDQIRGYYLTGSFADGSAVETSDIDLLILFKGHWQEETQKRAWDIRNYCWAITSADLDITLTDEEQLGKRYNVNFKLSSVHLYGEDVREQFPLTPLVQYLRDIQHSPFSIIARVRDHEPMFFPLDYPDSEAAFYGYTQRKIRSLSGGDGYGLKEIVNIVGLIASAAAAQAAQTYIVRKADCLRLYQEHIHDEWTGLVEGVFEKCRHRWQYLIPESAAEQAQLLAICRDVLAFENFYLERYKHHLLEDLKSGDADRQRFAVRRLGQMVYPDSQVEVTLEAIKSADGDLQAAVQETLGIMRTIISQRTSK